jgi:redox-sensitive bicupin YhaK (pirin superfamily)
MKTALHKAATRGYANHGWLDSWQTFSFAGYTDPSRMRFGALRVLNDDTVVPGAGFGRHSHDNMEIVTIPLDGSLEHADSMGNKSIIRQGDVQVMSAGTGISHAEKNAAADKTVRFLQIWVVPNQRNVTPRYDQKNFSNEEQAGRFVTIVSPIESADGGVQIYQDAWFSLGRFSKEASANYRVNKESNGIYVFLIEGDITVNDIVLNRRDGLAVEEEKDLLISVNEEAIILLIEVPV